MEGSVGNRQERPGECGSAPKLGVVQVDIRKVLSFRSAAFSREESAVLLPAASRFLADKAARNDKK
jgi:hypothetical protein